MEVLKKAVWFVYIIENEKGFYYTGITTDVTRRFREHSSSKKGAKFFKTGAPVKIVFKKKFPDRSLASKFECQVKKLTRVQKIKLISSGKMKNA